MKRSWRFYLAGTSVLLTTVVALLSLSQAQPKGIDSVVATYSHGTVRV